MLQIVSARFRPKTTYHVTSEDILSPSRTWWVSPVLCWVTRLVNKEAVGLLTLLGHVLFRANPLAMRLLEMGKLQTTMQ
ncbi:hypothetical protein FJTKL_00185 [Diaporthe vaccinii]|uniref:Uncharacterized protein n=1 Tax=Diaporthe vaccinii TaxID=105482 RepID=A0ABR4E428_9PEZI